MRQLDTASSKRNQVLDISRGFAIILVCLGHAIQNNIVDFDSSKLFEIIYSFHMPLFMFISGAVAYLQKSKIDSWDWLANRFCSLIIPFVVWIFVPYIFFTHTFPLADIYKRIKDIIKSPDWGLWFLYVLFVLDFILFVCIRLSKKIKIPLIISVLLIFCLLKFFCYLFSFWYLGIGLILWHYFFFFAGFFVFAFKEKILNKDKLIWISLIILAILALFFIACVKYWRRCEPPVFVNSKIYLELSKYFGFCTITNLLYKYLIPLGGISLTLLVSKIIDLCSLNNEFTKGIFNFVKRIMVYLGTITLELYVLSRLCYSYVTIRSHLPLHIVIDTIVSIIVPVCMIYLLRDSLLYKILFGKFRIGTRK